MWSNRSKIRALWLWEELWVPSRLKQSWNIKVNKFSNRCFRVWWIKLAFKPLNKRQTNCNKMTFKCKSFHMHKNWLSKEEQDRRGGVDLAGLRALFHPFLTRILQVKILQIKRILGVEFWAVLKVTKIKMILDAFLEIKTTWLNHIKIQMTWGAWQSDLLVTTK